MIFCQIQSNVDNAEIIAGHQNFVTQELIISWVFKYEARLSLTAHGCNTDIG